MIPTPDPSEWPSPDDIAGRLMGPDPELPDVLADEALARGELPGTRAPGENETVVRAQLAAERVDVTLNANARFAITLAQQADRGVDVVNALREARFQMARALAKGAPLQGGTLTKLRGGKDTSAVQTGRRTRTA